LSRAATHPRGGIEARAGATPSVPEAGRIRITRIDRQRTDEHDLLATARGRGDEQRDDEPARRCEGEPRSHSRLVVSLSPTNACTGCSSKIASDSTT
jgi:hypothetical protein